MVPLWHVHSCALLLVMLPRRVADPRSAKPPLGALPFRVWFMKGWGLSLVPFLFSNFHFLLRLWTLSDLFCFLRPLPTFPFTLTPSSGGNRKRVLDVKSGNLLPRIQIFREEPCRTALGCRGDDEGIPEADPRFVFHAECHRKLGGSGFHAPDGVTADHQACRLLWQGRANLAGYVHVELLQDLHAQNTRTCGPKLAQNVFGGDMLGLCIHIVGVNQHIGIDKGPTVHVILPGWLEYRLPSESLGQGAPRPGARRVRILLPRPPGFQSAAPAIR